jgi:hypothetical protein
MVSGMVILAMRDGTLILAPADARALAGTIGKRSSIPCLANFGPRGVAARASITLDQTFGDLLTFNPHIHVPGTACETRHQKPSQVLATAGTTSRKLQRELRSRREFVTS